MLLGPFYFRQHFGALPPSDHQYTLQRVADPCVSQGCVSGVRIEGYRQTPFSPWTLRQAINPVRLPAVCGGAYKKWKSISTPRVRRAGVWCLQEMEINYIPCNAYVTEGVGENWLWFLRRGGPAHRVSIEGYPRPKEFLTAGPLYSSSRRA